VFRLVGAVPLEHQASVALGDFARLVGYEIHPEPAIPGEPVHVTLYWRALKQASIDYSVFVHLLDNQNQIIAQSDGQPVQGYYPTRRWRPGDLLGDRHTLDIPSDQPPAEYHLAVGMYYWQTLERLQALAQDGARLPDDYVLLSQPVIITGLDFPSEHP